MTTTTVRPPVEAAAPETGGKPPRRAASLLQPRIGIPIVLVVWILGSLLLSGQQTLAIGRAQLTGFQTWLNGVKDSFDLHREDNFILNTIFGGISNALTSVVEFFQNLLSTAPAGRPYPQIGFLGAVALLVFLGLVVAGVRAAASVLITMLAFAYFGLWQDGIDTLIITFVAVAICVVIGIPVGILMARSKPATTCITPILDVMQTMPAFAYLAPLTLFFTIGPAAAVAITLVYAIAPLIRITAHGIRTVAPGTVEAADSLGATRRQTLYKVQLPMARRTIVVGLNQCTMAALSMATIAALIDGPGLGQPVAQALQSLDIGTAFVSGIAIVIMAIVLDRTTTAASERSEVATRRGESPRIRRIGLIAGGVVALVCVYLSRLYLQLAQFPSQPDLGAPLAAAVSAFTDALVRTVSGFTTAMTDVVSTVLLNPLQSLLAGSPWWLMFLVLLAVAYLTGGWRPTVTTAVC